MCGDNAYMFGEDLEKQALVRIVKDSPLLQDWGEIEETTGQITMTTYDLYNLSVRRHSWKDITVLFDPCSQLHLVREDFSCFYYIPWRIQRAKKVFHCKDQVEGVFIRRTWSWTSEMCFCSSRNSGQESCH